MEEVRNVITEDNTTLFVCSGMQNHKQKFREAQGGVYGSFQSCIRTNDLELVGDGSHLTHFVMLGNFSFSGPSYSHSAEMWHAIMTDFSIASRCKIHVHPTRDDHRRLWQKFGYDTVDDESCEWSDGEVGGNCCEVYLDDLEIGNLVNPLEHSTDVGFGWERLVQVLEGKSRVDETSLFDQTMPPIVRDHVRTIRIMMENGIFPGNKGREYVCRRLLRRVVRSGVKFGTGFADWIEDEKELLVKRLKAAKKAWKRHQEKNESWWWDTFGILPEEMELLSS